MASSHNFERVYGPDFLKVMTTAFDYAHESLPAKLQENDRAKRRLALLILRHIELESTIQSVSLPRPCWISFDDPVGDEWRNVRFWHKADMSLCTAHVRFRG